MENILNFLDAHKIEILGNVATCFVLLSFLMRRVTVIRIINIIGSAGFIVYGVLLGALSVWILNSALIAIHIFYLIFVRGEKRKKGAKLAHLKKPLFKQESLHKDAWFATANNSDFTF
jgi:hypothetical protein